MKLLTSVQTRCNFTSVIQASGNTGKISLYETRWCGYWFRKVKSDRLLDAITCASDQTISLHSAPGGWTKYAYSCVHPKSKDKKEKNIASVGKVISVDLKGTICVDVSIRAPTLMSCLSGLQLDENLRHGLHFLRMVLYLYSMLISICVQMWMRQSFSSIISSDGLFTVCFLEGFYESEHTKTNCRAAQPKACWRGIEVLCAFLTMININL